MKHIAALAPVLLPCLLNAQVVINEVDYDQPGSDAAEFIEIKNIGTTAFPLQYLALVFVNGAAGAPATYLTISSPSWPALEPGAYFVICANAATANCGHVSTPATNLIQNGVPDAIALVNTQTDEVLDMLSYGGDVTGYTEGTGTTAVDVNAVDDRSLNRWPDGTDTNNNNADFRLGCSTPGATNLVDDVLCSVPSGVSEIVNSAPLIVMPDPSGERLLLSYGSAADGPVTFEVFGRDGALLASRTVQGDTKAMWSMPAHQLRGQLLVVRASTATSQQTRRVVLP
ncbi:MAG: lamin tail domain-containing protein [Flavobacteriales bacterium]|nr:lamin tail domain-containing protein [Flavobacteriales bacterium]